MQVIGGQNNGLAQPLLNDENHQELQIGVFHTPGRTAPRKLPQTGWRAWCGGRAVTVGKGALAVAALTASVAVRVASVSPLWNVASSIGIGVGAQSLVNCFYKNKHAARVEQVSLTLCGQGMLYAASQIWDNTKNTLLQRTCITAIGVMLGVNVTMYAREFIRNHFVVRTESGTVTKSSEAQFKRVFLPPQMAYLKVAACVGCAVGWYFAAQASMPVLAGLASWGALYYGTDFVAQKLCDIADKKIAEETQQVGNRKLTELSNSRWRVAKTVINTVGFFAIPLSWVPWPFLASPRTAARSKELWVIGLITGLFDGFAYRSQENRFRNIPISQLDELKPRSENESAMVAKARKVGRVGIAMLAISSLLYFCISQFTNPQMDHDDKTALGFMLGGTLLTFLKNCIIDSLWNLENRVKNSTPSLPLRLLDRGVIMQNLPRILGVNPIYLYFILTNSMLMHSGQQLTSGERFLYYAGWGTYGVGMANEFQLTWGERKGLGSHASIMLFMNAILTMVTLGKGLDVHG